MPFLDIIYCPTICSSLIRRVSAVYSWGPSGHLRRKIVLSIICYFSPSTGVLMSVLTVTSQIDFLSLVKKEILADTNTRELFLTSLDHEPLQGKAAI